MVALCWFYNQLAWWFPKASHVCPSSRQTCSSSWHHLLLDWCFLTLQAFQTSGGHPQEPPVSGTPWACGSGWVRPWEPVSSGGMMEGEEGRTCWPVRCTGQSEQWGGGCPLLGTTACCSCRSHWLSPGASSSRLFADLGAERVKEQNDLSSPSKRESIHFPEYFLATGHWFANTRSPHRVVSTRATVRGEMWSARRLLFSSPSSSGLDKKRSHFPLKINKTAAQSEHAHNSKLGM